MLDLLWYFLGAVIPAVLGFFVLRAAVSAVLVYRATKVNIADVNVILNWILGAAFFLFFLSRYHFLVFIIPFVAFFGYKDGKRMIELWEYGVDLKATSWYLGRRKSAS